MCLRMSSKLLALPTSFTKSTWQWKSNLACRSSFSHLRGRNLSVLLDCIIPWILLRISIIYDDVQDLLLASAFVFWYSHSHHIFALICVSVVIWRFCLCIYIVFFCCDVNPYDCLHCKTIVTLMICLSSFKYMYYFIVLYL